MFIPNRTCHMRRKGKTFTGHGQPSYGALEAVRFALVRFDTKTEESTVRADSSATRGNVNEYHASGRILVRPNVIPKWGDMFIIEKQCFKVKEVEPRFNVLGKLDHYELDLEKADDVFGDTK
jgi:hypothetical protein